ncbi:beta strand repeat-containing protein [Gaoshiqia sp. Z1-71]|uniref:beta strand repeat-containing protein n=1 Tax=Gaoshiqia hydrogeniformans TaxID=3290090 RepID=UPI003BF8C343
MRKSYVILAGILLLLSFTGSGQSGGVSIGKGNLPAYEKAILEIVSESKGILIPRMTTTQRQAIFNDNDMEAKGLLVYDTTADCLYAWDGQIWNSFCNSGSVTVGSGNTFPAEPALGEIFFNTTTGQLYYNNGTTWVSTGNATVPTETLTTLTDNGDGTLTYVDENGASTVIDLVAIISGNGTPTSLTDNGDGTMTYTNEDGVGTVINTTVLGANVQIADGTIDIDGDGTPDNNLNLQDIVNNIGLIVSAQETLTTLTDNGDGTLTYVDENGAPTVIDLTALISGNGTPTSLTDNGDGTLTYTNEDGVGTVINTTVLGANVQIADGTVDIDGDGTPDNNLNLQDIVNNIGLIVSAQETLTTLTDNGDGTLTYVDENGAPTVIDLTALISGNGTPTSLTDNGDGTMTYTNEDGVGTVINTTVLGANVQIADGTVDIDGDGTPDNNLSLQDIVNNIGLIVSAQETLTTLTDNGDGTLTYVDENGAPTVIDLTALISGNGTPTSLTDNGDGTMTYTNEDGVGTVINTTVLSANVQIADGTIDIDGDGTPDNNLSLQDIVNNIGLIVSAQETLTTLTDNGDGTYTYTSEDATTTTINTIANEPWFGTDDHAPATLNTEDIYTMGRVAIGAVAVNANADLELASTTKGLLTNRVALTATTNPAPLSAHVAGIVVYNTATSGSVTPGIYYNDGTKWVAVAGGGIKKDVYSAEYAGATLVGTGLGSMTSDNTGAPTYMNYYEWTSTQAIQQEYQVMFRFTLPLNFVDWTATPITIDYVVSGVASIAVDAIPIGGSTVSTSGSSTTWAQVSLSPVMVAGQTAVIVLKLRSTSGGIARVGDITLNYMAK